MKCTVKATELKAAIKAMVAVHSFGEAGDRQVCCLRVGENLTVESSNMGAYCRHTLDCTVLREGTCVVNAKDLAALKLQGDVTLDHSSKNNWLEVKAGKSQYRLVLNPGSSDDVQVVQVQAAKGTKAKIPGVLLKSACQYGTFKSSVKNDFNVQITLDNQYIEFVGLDAVSFGRYMQRQNPEIKAQKRFCFVLNSALLDKVVGELPDETCTVALAQDKSAVAFTTDKFELVHPCVDHDPNDVDGLLESITKQGLSCSFMAEQQDLKAAVEAVGVMAKTTHNIVFKVTQGKVTVIAGTQGTSAAQYRVAPNNIKLPQGDVHFSVPYDYIAEFMKTVPQASILVEIWNNKFIHLTPQIENVMIDYGTMSLDD